MINWQQKLMEFVDAVHRPSDKELIEQAAQKFQNMIYDIEIVQARLEELRDTLQGAVQDALRFRDLQ
jgi:hypothetical protein